MKKKVKVAVEPRDTQVLLKQVHTLLKNRKNLLPEDYKIMEKIVLLGKKQNHEEIFDAQLEQMVNAISKFDFSKRLPISDGLCETQSDYIAPYLNRVNEQLEDSAISVNMLEYIISAPADAGVIITNSEGNIRFINEKIRQLFKEEKFKNRLVQTLFNPCNSIEQILEEKENIQEMEMEITVNNTTVSVLLDVFFAKNKFAETEGLLFILKKDVTDSTSFKLSRLAHDFMEPSNSTYSLIKFLQENHKASEEYIKLLLENNSKFQETAKKTLSNLNSFGNNQRVYIQFKKLVDDVIQSLRFTDGFNEVKVNTHIENTTDFFNDPEIIRSILQNLISNSIKYRKRNQVNQVLISVINCTAGIQLIIKDSGIGMNKEQQNKLFNRGFRGSNTIEGNGFGLYSLQEHIRKLKASIEVHSTLGMGSTFTITFFK